MAKCYMDAFYQKPSIPRKLKMLINNCVNPLGDDIVSMSEAMNPHLAFSKNIEQCLMNNDVIANLHALLFAASGLNQWRDESLERLENEYREKIQKFGNLSNTGLTLREFLDMMDFSETKHIISNWRKANNAKMRAEFVKDYDVEKYNQIDNEQDPERKKMMIDNYVDQNSSEYREWGGLREQNIEHFKNIYLNDMDHRYNSWRRKLSPFSLLINSAYLKFAEVLIEKFIEKKSDMDGIHILKGMLNRIKTTIAANISIVAHSFLNKLSDYKTFIQPYQNLENWLNANVIISPTAVNEDYVPKFPKVKRVIWFVRHGERLDNDKNLKNEVKNTKSQQYNYNGRNYNFDNSPLNETGEIRAMKLNNVFDNIDIRYLFASPYDRTIQTAVNLLGVSHKNFLGSKNRKKLESELKIKIEPGFMESMIDCVGRDIGYLEFDELKEHYGRLDTDYQPILNKNSLFRLYKEKEGRKSDIGCIERVQLVLNKLLENAEQGNISNPFYNNYLHELMDNGEYKSEWILPGEENAEHIVIVTHGLAISAIQNLVGGVFTYSPQTSITKIVELDPSSAYASHHTNGSSTSTGKNYLENLRLVYSGVTEHFDEDLNASYFKH